MAVAVARQETGQAETRPEHVPAGRDVEEVVPTWTLAVADTDGVPETRPLVGVALGQVVLADKVAVAVLAKAVPRPGQGLGRAGGRVPDVILVGRVAVGLVLARPAWVEVSPPTRRLTDEEGHGPGLPLFRPDSPICFPCRTSCAAGKNEQES